jgi:KDO2-lipid IV(A) lauroyltransferase
MNRLKKTKRNVVYILTRWAFFWFNVIPRRLAVFLGACLGLAAWSVLPKDRYKIQRHLSLVFGSSLSTSDKYNVGRDFFVNTGKNLAEIFRFKKHFATEIKPLVTVEGLEEFGAAYKRGKGLIGITGHIGNFELLAAYIASLGYRIAVIGRELYDARLNQMLVDNREALGLTNFSTTESPRTILRWLKSGGALGVLIDTDSTRVRGAFVPFFGRLANTPIGQSLLGLHAGAAFLPMACLRTDDNRYRIIIKREVCISPSGNMEEDACQMTQACTKVLEKIIAENKSQWIWLHNRWHTSPKNTI